MFNPKLRTFYSCPFGVSFPVMRNMARLSLFLLVSAPAVFAADALMGTWKVIPESAQYPGGAGPRNVVVKYEPTETAGEVKFTLTGEMNDKPYS